MDCRQVHQAYSVYLQGKLAPTQKDWIARHIHECPDCYLLDQKVRNSFVDEVTHSDEGELPVKADSPLRRVVSFFQKTNH